MKVAAKFVRRAVRCFAVLAALPFAMAAQAADTAATGQPEEIVVTGSYIKGSAENAALPVDVITAKDLEDQGNPTMIEFVRQLGITSGNLAETNQFTAPAQGTEGITTINLRGLGSGRTLTLINGRRQVSTESNGVDVSAFPQSAFARTEILKDGAAALYGSDAIAGVVNFISREGFEGVELSGSQTWIDESDGNNFIDLAMGAANDKMNGFVALEYDHRSELHIRDRDWGLKPFVENLAGGWSSTGMPGTTYLRNPNIVQPPGTLPGTNQQSFRGPDPQCAALGGEVLFGTCNFQFSYYDNLVEKTNTYKGYAEFNYHINDTTKFHFEGLYSELDMPHWNSSPGYPPNSLFGPDRIVPATNPGLIQYKKDYPQLFTNLPAGTTLDTVQVYQRSRIFGVNGQYNTGQALSGYRRATTYRIGAGLSGDAFDGGFGYNLNVTYSSRDRKSNGYDMQVQGMAFALNGLGGPGCTPGGSNAATSTPGSGPCQYYNPFSEAIPFSAPKAVANPTFNPAVGNSPELLRWLILEASGREINELLVWDAVFDKDLGIELPGGTIGWAGGVQARREKYSTQLSDVANRKTQPCPWTNPYAVTLGFVTANQLSPNCEPKNGLIAFGVPGDEANTSRTVYGAFSELAVPITDNINMQAAIRFEDYGTEGGSTVDPKVSMKWQVFDWVALRGSYQTTFRGPPQSYLSGENTYLQNIPAANAYRAVNIIGNPELNPESADVISAGIIFEVGGLTATIDYWDFDFKDPFQIESAGQLLTAYTGAGCFDGGAGAPNGALGPISPTCQDLRPHVEPIGTTPANLAAINTNIINGPKIQTDGFDVAAQYVFDLSFGEITVGAEGSYTIKYKSDDFKDLGGVTLAPGGDFVGLMNIGLNPFYPMPDTKGNAFVRYSRDNWRFSYTVRYVDSYKDKGVAAINAANAALIHVDDMTTQDATLIYMWKDLTVSGSVFNITDEDPPQCYCALEYDAYTANPLGRMYKLQVTYSLGGK